ncbi:MAG: hypothetical protein R3E39_03785 [Anaerolineae bacterium]
MTSKSQSKFLLFIVGMLVAIPLSVLTVRLVAQFITYFQQGADPASIFRAHKLIVPDFEDIHWSDVAHHSGKTPTPAVQAEIAANYWTAWEAFSRAQQTGDTSDMATYWSGTAYQQVLQGIDKQQSFLRTHTGHILRLRFFSDDDSVVAFQDAAFTLVLSAGDMSFQLTTSADVVMTLDQGFWRVRSIMLAYH